MHILVFVFDIAALAHRYLQVYAPSNALVAIVRRGRPRLGLAAGLLALSLMLAAGAMLLAGWMARGGPRWLYLIVLIAIWDALNSTVLATLTLLASIQTAVIATGLRPRLRRTHPS